MQRVLGSALRLNCRGVESRFGLRARRQATEGSKRNAYRLGGIGGVVGNGSVFQRRAPDREVAVGRDAHDDDNHGPRGNGEARDDDTPRGEEVRDEDDAPRDEEVRDDEARDEDGHRAEGRARDDDRARNERARCKRELRREVPGSRCSAQHRVRPTPKGAPEEGRPRGRAIGDREGFGELRDGDAASAVARTDNCRRRARLRPGECCFQRRPEPDKPPERGEHRGVSESAGS